MINFLHLKITQDYLIIQVGKYVTEATNGYLLTNFSKVIVVKAYFFRVFTINGYARFYQARIVVYL